MKGKGHQVFNYTDNIYATNEVFTSKKKAKEFIVGFRKRFDKQGYYRNNRMEKISPAHIDLEIIPEDFSPYKK